MQGLCSGGLAHVLPELVCVDLVNPARQGKFQSDPRVISMLRLARAGCDAVEGSMVCQLTLQTLNMHKPAQALNARNHEIGRQTTRALPGEPVDMQKQLCWTDVEAGFHALQQEKRNSKTVKK